jgi:Fe-Mn family superoxide dismutase
MAHEARNFDHLLGKLQGISDNQLKQHFTLYQGYVKKINEIEEKLGKTDNSAANYSFNEYSELKRREPVALNGSYLHELYFENLTGGGSQPSDGLKKLATDSFGSWDNFIKDCRMAGTSTPGWVLVTRSRVDNKLHNYIAYEHHLNIPVQQDIVMALDCWEHAFMIDFGIKKADYFDAFFKNCDWKMVSSRLDKFSKYTR